MISFWNATWGANDYQLGEIMPKHFCIFRLCARFLQVAPFIISLCLQISLWFNIILILQMGKLSPRGVNRLARRREFQNLNTSSLAVGLVFFLPYHELNCKKPRGFWKPHSRRCFWRNWKFLASKRDAFRGPVRAVANYAKPVTWRKEETWWLQGAVVGIIDWNYAWSQRVVAKLSKRVTSAELYPDRATKQWPQSSRTSLLA